MEDNIFFSCEKIVVVPSKILLNYPNLSWMNDYFNDSSGVVVLFGDTITTRENLNNINIIAFAVIIFKKKKAEIIDLATPNTIQFSAVFTQDILLNILTYILSFIKSTFYKPVFVKIDTTDIKQIDFYVENGFIKVPKKSTQKKIYLLYNSHNDYYEKSSINDIVLPTEINNQLVMFPASLAKILSPYVQLNHEVGGNICIDHVIQKKSEDICVLGLATSRVIKGTLEGVIFDDMKTLTPFSFHSHPDITITLDSSSQRYISWPSGTDMRAVLLAFYNKVNLLAHFVVTSEGIWVIHITVPFQKIISNLTIFNKYDLFDIIEDIKNLYDDLEEDRLTNFVEPLIRNDVKRLFLEKSNTLSIKDLPSVQNKHYKGDNFYLFKLKLLTWKRLKNDTLLKFPYFINPEAGLPEKLSSTCDI